MFCSVVCVASKGQMQNNLLSVRIRVFQCVVDDNFFLLQVEKFPATGNIFSWGCFFPHMMSFGLFVLHVGPSSI